MENCIFCQIANGNMSAKVVHEDQDIIAFRDINPQAPTHILVIPKKHISTINDISSDDAELIGKITLTAKEIAKKEGFSERGYRLVFNCNRDGGQQVYHIHLHLLGGRVFHWPPG